MRVEFITQAYSPGDRVSQDFAIPIGYDFIRITLPIRSWPATNNTVVEGSIELSFDGGQTWRLRSKATFPGIPATGPDGQPITECSLASWGIKQTQNAQRRARVRMNVISAITTGVELEATEVRLVRL